MRFLILFCWCFSISACAEVVELSGDQAYRVPDNQIWIIEHTPVADCRVCTADVYIEGELSNVEIQGVIFHGEFTFSFSSPDHSAITLYPATEIRLGDSRQRLKVRVEPLPE